MSRSGVTKFTFSGEILLLLSCQSRSFWRRIASYSRVVHLLSEQSVRSEGVLPTREPGIPSCAEWGWKAVQLPKVTAHIYPWDSCCTNRPRTQDRCPHRRWFIIGACLATEERKDISESYATLDFLPVIHTAASMTWHTVFDVYSSSSLKADTRSKCGQGGRRKVTKKNTVPSNWRNFLRHNDNKMEFSQLLAEMIALMLTPNWVVTNGPDVLSTHEIGFNGLNNCYHEEADSPTFVHAKFALEHGGKAIMIKANDTDVVVIALCVFPTLQRLGLEQLWVTFGQGHSLRWIGVHDVSIYGWQDKRHIIVSCIHMLWHCVSLQQEGQENGMADRGHLSRGLPCFLQTESVTSHSGRWWPGDAGEVCHIDVR